MHSRNSVSSMRSSSTLALTLAVALTALGGSQALAQESGDVLAEARFDVTSDDWLAWNGETCLFEPAEGSGDYVAQVKASDAGNRIVFTPEEQTNAIFVDEAKKLVELGEAAGVEVIVLDNAFPDTEVPIQVADQAVQLEVDLVLSQLILPDLNPVVQTKYKDACIPMVNVFGMPNYPFPAPTVQAIHGENGVSMANAAIGLAEEKGWPADQIWIVSCGEPQEAAGEGTAEDLILRFRDTVKEAFAVPDERISEVLVCPQADGPLGSKVAVTDWATAHPDAKYVIGSAWSDVRALGMAQGLEASGYTPDTAIIAGRDANQEMLDAMKAGSILQVNLDLDLVDGWATAMLAVAQDIIAGNPVPSFVVPEAVPITPADL